jgi:hypothetical protein
LLAATMCSSVLADELLARRHRVREVVVARRDDVQLGIEHEVRPGHGFEQRAEVGVGHGRPLLIVDLA